MRDPRASAPYPLAAATNTKRAVLLALLAHFRAGGHRTLVFSFSRTLLDLVTIVLAADGVKGVARMDGHMKSPLRVVVVAAFNASAADAPGGSDGGAPPPSSVMWLTKQVGALTLTATTRVVLLKPHWFSAADEQAVDRACRFGQRYDVLVVRLVTVGGTGERIVRRPVTQAWLVRLLGASVGVGTAGRGARHCGGGAAAATDGGRFSSAADGDGAGGGDLLGGVAAAAATRYCRRGGRGGRWQRLAPHRRGGGGCAVPRPPRRPHVPRPSPGGGAAGAIPGGGVNAAHLSLAPSGSVAADVDTRVLGVLMVLTAAVTAGREALQHMASAVGGEGVAGLESTAGINLAVHVVAAVPAAAPVAVHV